MKKRLSHKPLHKARKIVLSCLVCSVALFPIFGIYQVSALFVNKDPRKVIDFEPFLAREVDKEAPKLFEEPIISVTFDDGRESVYTNAMPLLNKYGIRATHYLLSGTLDDKNYLSRSQIISMANESQEIDCHSITHPDLTTITNASLNIELEGCKKDLGTISNINDFASPYGHTNSKVLEMIKRYYRSHRNTDGDIVNGTNQFDVNLPENFNQYSLISVAVRQDTSIEQLTSALDYTRENKGWLILTYHQIEDGNNATFGLDPSSLDEQFQYLSASDIKIAPLGEVLDTFSKNIFLGDY